MAYIPLLVFLSLTHPLFLSISAEEKRYNPRCSPFPCGDLGLLRFPFNNMTNPECGVLTVDCSGHNPKIKFKEGGHWYNLTSISQANSIFIDEKEPQPFYSDLLSCEKIRLLSFPSSPSVFSYYNFTGNSFTLYNCSHGLGLTKPKFFNEIRCGDYDIYFNPQNLSFPFEHQCSINLLPLPVSEDHHPNPTKEVLLSTKFTFVVRVSLDCIHCHDVLGGKCQTNSGNQFYCSNARKVVAGKNLRKLRLRLGLGIAAIFAGILVLLIMLFCCLRKFSSNGLTSLWKNQNSAGRSIAAFLRNCGPLQVRRFSYLDVKKMTKSFKEKLGQGGFGSVYRGMLHDGCLVAVKVLNESKANGEEFINEVATISRTSHVNIVTLLGFCFEGAKRALIYEYMPNGSLEKFIFDENATEESYPLDWETYYQISLGIARGLEYLHRGCNTRILHFDIKPHNILLDADFVPKISDFGLAKICARKDSLISMLGPRGTIGYIAPEVFYRSFGGVSHKSDVYSYGMMVLEIVGGRKNVNVRVDNTSEIYFPQWIYKRLEVEELGLKRILNEEDKVKVRKMIIMSLWCIQTDPSNRPAMNRVIEMLEGSLDSLEVPPKPFMSSPPRLPPSESSSTFVSLQL